MTLRSNLKLLRFLPVLLASLLAAPLAHAQISVLGDGGPGPIKAPHLTVELVADAPAIAPGGTLQAGLLFTLEGKWHIYWINAGDSGDPPKVTWNLPAGITTGPMLFPIPSRLPLGPLMDFGYEDAVAFPIQLMAAKSLKPGPTHLDANVSWLVCREVCIPGKAHLGLNLTVDPNATVPARSLGALGESLKLIPEPPPPSMKFSVTGGKNDFVLTFITGATESDAEFYPFDQEQIANAAPQVAELIPDGVRIRVKRDVTLKTLPPQLHGVLKLSDEKAYDVTAPVVPGEVPTAPSHSVAGKKATIATVATAIGLAFLGGIILNLMPCVFPVLFLKGLALVQSSDKERSHQRSHGLIYTLGILASFWAIVAVLLILRAGGTQAGWGFQLQSPTFIVLLAAGLFFFALSLAGQFELGLSLTSVGGGLAQKQGYTGSFFTGVLATVVATPCTAPLMGAAIGFALAQPSATAFAVFTALGLGLATPYLLLTFNPGWTRLLPRPGAWMETLKQLTSVLLFGTVIWLAWVYGSLYSSGASGVSAQGVDRLAHLLWGLLAIAIAGWVLGKWPAKWPSTIAAMLLIAIGLAFPLYQPKDTTLTWTPYSQKALDEARAAGHPVFIDFTAAWCLSCQVNERAVLRSDDVQHQFASRKFTLLKADWTQYDPEITRQLTAINRQGVPTYVVYPANPQAMPDVLPELLTKSIVLTALETSTKK